MSDWRGHHTAVEKCPSLAAVGQDIFKALEPIVARRDNEMNACLEGLGTDECPCPPEDLLQEVREAIGKVVGTDELGEVADLGDGIRSSVRAKLLSLIHI